MVLYSPPGNKNYVCTASMIMTSYSPPRMIFVSSTTIYSSRNSGLVGKSNIHISYPTGSRIKLLLTILFATQGKNIVSSEQRKMVYEIGSVTGGQAVLVRSTYPVSLLYRTLGKFGSPLQFSTDMPPSVYCCLRKN